jgi:hypothetical protein
VVTAARPDVADAGIQPSFICTVMSCGRLKRSPPYGCGPASKRLRAVGAANPKGNPMKISRIATLAGLGMLVMTLPTTAAPALSGSSDVRAAKPELMQLAQNRTRQIAEERGGLYKKKAKKKKGKKKM